MADNAVARPEGGLQDVREAVQSLVDTLNDQAKSGLSHAGRVVTVTLGATNTEISHQLGRVPSFVIPVGQNASASIFQDTPHSDPRNFLFLKSSATVTANILIA